LKHEEYMKHDALSLAELVRRREVSAAELLETAISRADAVNPQLNAIVLKHYDMAREAIKHGLPEGPLTGVPFLVKDLFIEMQGTVTTNGSCFLKERVASSDSTIATRYRQAGLVTFGKTHSPEMGSAPSAETRLWGQTLNPWNLALSPGGSSGGSAVAIAAGIVPAANATDAGGSIRIPASLTGLFGLKPTRGRVPLGPARFEGGGGIATLHAITRSVRDSAALLDAASGAEPGALYGVPFPINALAATGRDPGRLRIAVSMKGMSDGTLTDACRSAAEDAAKKCEALGHEVEYADAELDREQYRRARNVLLSSTMTGAITGLQRLLGREAGPDDFEPATWKLYEQGLNVRGHEVLWAREVMFTLHRQTTQFMRRYDVVLSPSLQAGAPPVGSLNSLDASPEAAERIERYIAYTLLYNMTGQPSMSVPLYWTVDGMPIGALFTGRFGAEETLFSLAAQLEKAHPWFHRLPLEPYVERRT
jgi:amidase